jgi:8-hydroxy-5-deazaflavin:NADPH oxidoreductase
MKKIGILGTGDVGKALGKGFIGLGHEVKMGSREPNNERATAWAKEMGDKASAGTFAEAATFGDIVVLATLGMANESALKMAGPENLNGKVVIDTTNPLDFSKGFPPSLALGHTDSGGEQVQRVLPGAHVVKCFNIIGSPHMVNPSFPGGTPDMFLCGNDDGAKATVTEILRSFGWERSTDLGGIHCSRYLEALCMVWVLYAAKAGSWGHAFSMLKK